MQNISKKHHMMSITKYKKMQILQKFKLSETAPGIWKKTNSNFGKDNNIENVCRDTQKQVDP